MSITKQLSLQMLQCRYFYNKIIKKQPNKPERSAGIKDVTSKHQEVSLDRALQVFGQALKKTDIKKLRNDFPPAQISQIQNKNHEIAMAVMRKLQLKDFSTLVHRLLVNYSGSNDTYYKLIWKQIQQNFYTRFSPTTNPELIRSYTKIIYCLAKSKTRRSNPATEIITTASSSLQNLQTKFSIILPFSSHQSFTTIVTSLARMGPLSEQFSYLVESVYYKRLGEFNAREKVQINYMMTRNGRQVDRNLVDSIDSMNLREIVTMLRCYKQSNQLFSMATKSKNNLLSFSQSHILARKSEMNAIDLAEICELYFEATVASSSGYKISKRMESALEESYMLLRKNINEVAFDKIWAHFPSIVNHGYLSVQLVEQIIKTLSILRKKNMFPQRIWKSLRQGFEKFENMEVRRRLHKIQ